MTITNLEMETAGIYGLAALLGHKAVSMNAIIANRVHGEFSKNPDATIAQLILYTLNNLVS
jgi:uridine phosphorylase